MNSNLTIPLSYKELFSLDFSYPFFQSYEFIHLCEGLDDQFVLLCPIINFESNEITGYFLIQVVFRPGFLRFFTTRALIWHGPVLFPGFKEEHFRIALDSLRKKLPWHNLFIQFRNIELNGSLSSSFRRAGFQFSERLNLVKRINPLEDAWKALSESRKRQIRNSKANGLEIIRDPSEEDIKLFYQILSGLYKRIKKPLPAVAFFVRFWQLSLKGELSGFISLARFRGRIVGGIVCPYDRTGRVYEYYICGLDKELAPFHVYPSVALTWEGMERGAQLGCTLLDFMGLGIPERPYGVRDFKLRFGGKVENPGRWNKIHNPVLYFLTEIAYNIKFGIQKILLF